MFSFLSNVTGDLANIAIPPSFLAAKSVTQVSASLAERPSSLAAPAKEADAQKRALLVLKLFIGALRTQFYVDGDVKGGNKKPLNSFLGEIYSARWTEGDNTTEIISEQVSYNPPITASYIWDKKHGISANRYARVEMSFNGNVNIEQYGHTMLHINKYNEDYLLPFPKAQTKGLMSGKLYPELTGTYQIVSTSGFVSELDFSNRTALGSGSGEKNQSQARVYKNGGAKVSVYFVGGSWSDKFTIRDASFNKILETVDTGVPPQRPQYIKQADPWEAQVAWKETMEHISENNASKAGAAKNKLEDAQRTLRQKQPEDTWQPLFFTSKDGRYPAFERLAQGIGLDLHKDKTKGIWRYDMDKANKASRPFHGDMTPMG